MLNMTNVLLWFLQGTSGAVAGYITNKYAVNMLFKEYMPFRIGGKVILPYKFGGVIKNRKEKFIEELSDLVERDIINGNTIKSQFASDEFKKAVNKLSYDFLDESLQESFENLRISDISGFEKTEEEILRFTQNNIEPCISNLVELIFNNIKIANFINEDEVSSASEKIYRVILDEVEKNKEEKFIENALYISTNDITINDILTENSKEFIKNNINSIAEELIFNLIDDDKKVVEIINSGLELSEVDELIDKLQNRIKEKKFVDFVNEDEEKKLSQYIFEKINSYLKQNGKKSISQFINSFVKIAEETDYTIYDFFGPEFSEKIIDFINKKLPVIMPYVSEWIKNNKNKLDTVIEESIDEAIGNMDPNIKKLIISKVREFFFNDISAKNKVVNKIVSYVENYKMDDEAIDNLINKIESYLRQTKIKDIIALLREKDIINESSINKLSEIFINEYKKHGQSFIEELIKTLFSKNIGAVIKLDFKELFNSKIKEKLIDYILDNRSKIKNSVGTYINDYINNKIQYILSKPIKSFIAFLNPDKSLEQAVLDNKDMLSEKIKEQILCYIANLNLYTKFEENKGLILNEVSRIFLNYEKETINKYKNKSISTMIDEISNKENISELIGNELIDYVNVNSENFLNGKVRKVVYDNLVKYDEDEICDLAQRFMGNELKPLSIFGGVLGLAAGLIFGAFFKNVNIFGFYKSVSEGILSIALMGAIGVLTNVIAISMLFKPYKKSKVLSKIPFLNKFALGYIPAHKDNLGKSIGKVIDDDILNSGKIQSLLVSNRENTLHYAIDYFENSNYKAIVSFINHKKNAFVEFIYKKLIKNISKDETVTGISTRIGNVKIDSFVPQKTVLSLIDKVKVNKNKIVNLSANYLFNRIHKNKTIEESISSHILNNINSDINEIIYKEILNKTNNTSFYKVISNYKEKYNNFIDKPINNIASIEIKESLENYIINNAESFVFNEIKYAAIALVKKKFINEFDGDKSIETLFDGRVKILINENLNKVTDIIIEKLANMLNKNEVLIGNKVKEEINSKLNFFEKIAYSVAGGDSIVESCVSILLNKKIPEFVNEKFYEINSLIQKSLDNVVYPMNIEELRLKTDELNISGLLNSIFEKGRNNQILLGEISRVCQFAVKSIYNENLADILKIINFNTLESLENKFRDHITFTLNNLKDNLEKNKEQSKEYIGRLVENNIISKAISMPIDRFLIGIKENDLYYALNILFDNVLSNEQVSEQFESALINIYEDKFANITLKDIYSESMINSSIEKVFISLLGNDKCLAEVKNSIIKAVDCLVDSNFEFIDLKFRREITNKIITGVIESVILNSKELVEAANLKSVTYEQIKLMDSKEIHYLFNSFAGEFFKKLYIYGAFGSVFGINLYLPIIWAVKEGVTTSIGNIKNGYKVKDNVE
ncbi:MAG: DUF445 family protein [Romboutsia sp.]|nr:DUF445 family protein [Romboutsia sp.]